MPQTVQIAILDKDSSGGMQKTFLFKNKEEFLAQWKEFQKEIPYSRWYPEVVTDNDATEKLVESWLEE